MLIVDSGAVSGYIQLQLAIASYIQNRHTVHYNHLNFIQHTLMACHKGGFNIIPSNGIEKDGLLHPKSVGFWRVILIAVVTIIFKEGSTHEKLLHV